jgi:hypothetical protein
VDRATGFKTRSLMAVPVIFGDTLYGVIELVNRGSGGSSRRWSTSFSRP